MRPAGRQALFSPSRREGVGGGSEAMTQMPANNQQGNVLIYSLLTIAAILSTTIVISNFVQSTIKQSRFVNNASSAFYAAEAGMEKALFSVRKKDIIPADGDCDVGSQCQLEINGEAVAELKLDLKKNQTVQFDLFNPGDNTKSSHVESVKLNWQNNGAWLELTYIPWSVGGMVLFPPWDESIEIGELSAQKMLFSGGSATVNAFSASKNYRVRVKALYQDAEDLAVNLYSLDNLQGEHLAFPNFLKIKTTGSFQESNQTINAEMPRYAPTLGLFDYVIFSEEIIKK